MLEVESILEQVASTDSRNKKMAILKANQENTLLQKVLNYTYCPYKIYGFGKKSLEGVDSLGMDMVQSRFTSIFELLDYLVTVNANNQVKNEVIQFLAATPPKLRDLYVRMILKDIRAGITEGSVNKVWKGLVPQFKVMLAKKYEGKLKDDTKFILTTKEDGSRGVAIIDYDGCVKFYTRTGQRIEGLVELEKEMALLPRGHVYDGELILENPYLLSSDDLFRETQKVLRKNGAKKGVEFHLFDMLPLEDFQKGKSARLCEDRKNILHDTLSKHNLCRTKEIEVLYIGTDQTKIDYHLNLALRSRKEGIMISLNAPYQCKRTSDLLKVKVMNTIDLEVIGFEEGEGKYENSLGAIIVEYKGYPVKVGSGYSDKDRSYIWENRDNLIGRIVEVQYFEESKNSRDDNLSLRFPVFKKIREEDKQVSYH